MGELTGRGSPYLRSLITGVGTSLDGIVHTLPFLIPVWVCSVVAVHFFPLSSTLRPQVSARRTGRH